MRRKEFMIDDDKVCEDILNECEYGVLSLVYRDMPYGVPLNFVYFDNMLCFHGAKVGKKIKALKKDARASFVAVKSYSLLPSYFSDEELACPATQFFASIYMEGNIVFIEDIKQKADILNALMKKLQPEGGYKKIDSSELYKKMLISTNVFVLRVASRSIKAKAGQNLDEEKFNTLLKKLEERGTKKDMLTKAIMQNFR